MTDEYIRRFQTYVTFGLYHLMFHEEAKIAFVEDGQPVFLDSTIPMAVDLDKIDISRELEMIRQYEEP